MYNAEKPMTTLPLHHLNSHLFLELADGLWMHDTGAPASFGDARNLHPHASTSGKPRPARGLPPR